MAIAFCAACDRLVYTNTRDHECPVCSGPLAETEETIRNRVMYHESSSADAVIVTDFPAHRKRSTSKGDDEEAKEGTP